MVAKRRLDFGTPGRKRVKPTPMVLYRGIKSEMKYMETNIPYVGLNQSIQPINLVEAWSIPAASGNMYRNGNKIKIHRVQVLVAETSSSGPIRVDLLLPKIATSTPVLSYGGFADPAECATLFTKFLHNGTAYAATGAHINFKLPLGIVSHYDGAAGTTCKRNLLYLAITTPAGENITVNARIWYTDA